MANPKDEFDRQQQAQATAAPTGQTKSLAASADPSNASRLAKVPPGIGGNPIVAAAAPPAQAQSNPIAQTAVSPPSVAQPARAASPAAPVQQGMTDAQREQTIGQIPTGGIASPSPVKPATSSPVAESPVAAGFMPGIRSVFNESGKVIGDLASQGRYGAAAGETARAALAYAPAVADDVIGGAIRTVGPAIMDAGKQFLGLGNSAQPPVQAPSVTTPAAVPAPAASTAVARTGPAPVAPMAATAPASASIMELAAPSAKQVSPGVYRSGNSYADSAAGAIAGIQPRVMPSAQNSLAADALAQRSQQESATRVAAAQPQEAGMGFSSPFVAHSGNDWAARQRLKDLETSASSITNRAEWRSGSSTPVWGSRQQQGVNDPDGKIGRFNAAMQADLVAQGKAPDAQLKTNEINAGLQRAAMNEQGENYRAAGKNAIAAAELSQRGKEINSQAELRNLEVQRAQRSAGILQRYDAAKDETERMSIIRQYPDVFGKHTADPQGKDRYITVGGGTTVVDGQTVKDPVRIFDTVTRQEVGGAEKSLPSMDTNKQAMAIRDNPKLTYDQKVAELEKLGYNR